MLVAAATNIYVVLAMMRHCIKMIKMYSFNPDVNPTGILILQMRGLSYKMVK